MYLAFEIFVQEDNSILRMVLNTAKNILEHIEMLDCRMLKSSKRRKKSSFTSTHF